MNIKKINLMGRKIRRRLRNQIKESTGEGTQDNRRINLMHGAGMRELE